MDKNCFNENNESSSYLGCSYDDNDLKTRINIDSKTYLTGGEKFWVKKMEVFQVKFDWI